MVKGCNTSLKCGHVEQLPNSDLVCTKMFLHKAGASGSWIFRSVSFDNTERQSQSQLQPDLLIWYRSSAGEEGGNSALTQPNVGIFMRPTAVPKPLCNIS